MTTHTTTTPTRGSSLTAALDRLSLDWLSVHAPDLVTAIDRELASDLTPAAIRFIVQRHVGPDRDGLALRCEQAARYLQSQRSQS